MKALRSLLLGSVLALALASTPARAQDWKFEFHGLVGGSAYIQDNRFNGEGGGVYWVNDLHPKLDKAIIGGDARETKLSLSATGPAVLFGAKPKGVIEYDLFGGAGPGNYTESELTRLRYAYVELNWGTTILQMGQQNHLMIHAPALSGTIPASLGHIGAPLILAAGYLGWRTPGITLYQNFPMEGFTVQLGAQVARQNFSDSVAAPGGVFLGRAGFPNTEIMARVFGKVEDFTYAVYGVYHYSTIDTSGWNAVQPSASTNPDSLTSSIFEIGAKFTYAMAPMKFNLGGNYYNGKNTGNLRGTMEQFQSVTGAYFTDIQDQAYWGQLGVEYEKWSVWFFRGHDEPDKTDMAKANLTRFANTNDSVMVKYTDGPVSVGLEYLNSTTEYAVYGGGGTAAATVTSTHKAYGQQLMLSTVFYF